MNNNWENSLVVVFSAMHKVLCFNTGTTKINPNKQD